MVGSVDPTVSTVKRNEPLALSVLLDEFTLFCDRVSPDALPLSFAGILCQMTAEHRPLGRRVPRIRSSSFTLSPSSPFHSTFCKSKGATNEWLRRLRGARPLKGELWTPSPPVGPSRKRTSSVECPGYSTWPTNAGLMWCAARVHAQDPERIERATRSS